MAVGSHSILNSLSRAPPLSESGAKVTPVIDVDEASLQCAKKPKKTSGCIGSGDAFPTLTALFVKKTKAE